MRRWTVFGLVMAVALALTTPVGAAADVCDRNPTHWKCGDPPTTTTTTQPPATTLACEPVITLSGSGVHRHECDWTPIDNGAATGIVTATPRGGEVSRLVVMIRDSSPGDICDLSYEGQLDDLNWYEGPLDDAVELSFSLADDRGSYWGYTNPADGRTYVGEHWCEPYDPEPGQRTDLNGEPLHLLVNARLKKGTEVVVTLSPPPVP